MAMMWTTTSKGGAVALISNRDLSGNFELQAFYTPPCWKDDTKAVLVATILEPLSPNPGIKWHVPSFGLRGTREICEAVLRWQKENM